MFGSVGGPKWESLPPDVQQAFTDVSREYTEKHGEMWDEVDRKGREYVLELGNLVEEQHATVAQGDLTGPQRV